MTKTGSLSASIGAAFLLAGCVASALPDYPVACMAEVNPPGAYGYPAGIAVPTVVPEAGGTQAGADAVNACIKTKAAAATQKPVATKAPAASNPAQTSGTMTTKTYTYGTPRDRNGKPILATTTPTPEVPRACSYIMVGGTGYMCDRSPMRKRN